MNQIQTLKNSYKSTRWMLSPEVENNYFGSCSLENERQCGDGTFYQSSSGNTLRSGSWSYADIKHIKDMSYKKTPFEERDDLMPDEERLLAMINRIPGDGLLPFSDQIYQSLKYLFDPDPVDAEAPLSPVSTAMFLRFMRESLAFEPPLLSVGINGGLVAGWQREKNWHVFLYFMSNGIVQYASRRPSGIVGGPPTVPTSGVLPRLFDVPGELEAVRSVFHLVFPDRY